MDQQRLLANSLNPINHILDCYIVDVEEAGDGEEESAEMIGEEMDLGRGVPESVEAGDEEGDDAEEVDVDPQVVGDVVMSLPVDLHSRLLLSCQTFQIQKGGLEPVKTVGNCRRQGGHFYRSRAQVSYKGTNNPSCCSLKTQQIGRIYSNITRMKFLIIFIKLSSSHSPNIFIYSIIYFSQFFFFYQSSYLTPINYNFAMSKLDPQALKAYIQDKYESLAIPSLIEYIKIDNLSRTFDAEWHSNGKLEAAANHIKDWVLSLNIQRLSIEVIKDQGYAPLIFTQIQGDIPNTLFFYGHYDKQPPFEGWMEGVGATNPKIIDGKLYGRGGADDGYSTYSTMLALKALQEQGVKLPRCVMVTEGDEESGSGHMKHYLETLKQRIGDPFAFFCLDSGTLDYDRLWLSTSLRGHLVATLKVTANLQGVHSGTYGGVLPSVHRITRLLLSRLENYETGEFNPKFKTDITPIRYQETVELASYMGSKLYDCFPLQKGTQPISTNPLVSLLKRNWHPTLTVTGQTGIPPVQGAGNILHPSTQVRISIRLPPNFPVEKAEPTLREILLTDVPYGAKAELLNLRASTGWNATEYEPYFVNAVKEASDIFYGNKMKSFGEGGTIPLMGLLQSMWPGRQFLITGVLGPHSNAHGPNEFLHIDYVKKLTCCLGYVVAKCSEHLEQQ